MEVKKQGELSTSHVLSVQGFPLAQRFFPLTLPVRTPHPTLPTTDSGGTPRWAENSTAQAEILLLTQNMLLGWFWSVGFGVHHSAKPLSAN